MEQEEVVTVMTVETVAPADRMSMRRDSGVLQRQRRAKQPMRVTVAMVAEALDTREARMALELVEEEDTSRTTLTVVETQRAVEMAEATEVMLVTSTISEALALQDVELETATESSQEQELETEPLKAAEEVVEAQEVAPVDDKEEEDRRVAGQPEDPEQLDSHRN